MLEGRAKIDPRGSFLTSGSHFGKTKEIIMKEDKGGRRTLYVRCRCGFFWGHWRSLFTRTLSLCTLSFSFPSLPPMRACVRVCACVCARRGRGHALQFGKVLGGDVGAVRELAQPICQQASASSLSVSALSFGGDKTKNSIYTNSRTSASAAPYYIINNI